MERGTLLELVCIVVKPAMERAASVRTGPAEIAFTRMFLAESKAR